MKPFKIFIVVLFAVVLTTVGISASDNIRGLGGGLLGQVIGSQTSLCPDGMVEVGQAATFACADIYEVSAGDKCPHLSPSSPVDTKDNLAQKDCFPESKKDGTPWTFINREEASLACMRAGKKLPDAKEWYTLAMGYYGDGCNTSSGEVKTSDQIAECAAESGVKNAVGNVWEWVSDDVSGQSFNQRALPVSGHVKNVDNQGVAVETSLEPDPSWPGYFWSKEDGLYGMMRGGFYGSKNDAGLYSIKADTAASFAGAAVGFRCVK